MSATSSSATASALAQLDSDWHGGYASGACSEWFLHVYFTFYSILGLFLMLSLVIAVFESNFSKRYDLINTYKQPITTNYKQPIKKPKKSLTPISTQTINTYKHI